ncbi:MAG: Zn-dependent exopeptidase M28 [Clostridiales bacterium]|jgi:hypothetical protein|nr:Zn-dependent exopeptidase M28 [Clostridiales bacterium]
MKGFKWVYYPVLVVLTAVFLTLGFVSVNFGDTKSVFPSAVNSQIEQDIKDMAEARPNSVAEERYTRQVADKLRSRLAATEKLTEGGEEKSVSIIRYTSAYDNPDDDGLNSRAAYLTEAVDGVSTARPTVVNQNAVLLPDTVKRIPGLDDNVYYADKQVKNVVLAIPGAATIEAKKNGTQNYGDVVMFTAHYDAKLATGGVSNLQAVAAMLEVARQLAVKTRTAPYKNDFLFVFTDASEEALLGAYAFKYQFTGFDNIFSRVKAGFNFEKAGAGGPVMLTAAAQYSYDMPETLVNSDAAEARRGAKNNNSGILNMLRGIGGANGTASSLYGGIYNKTGLSDFEIYDGIPALNFSTRDGATAGTRLDTVENLDKKTTVQYANLVDGIVKYLGDYALDKLSEGVPAGFFSYLGSAPAVYPYAVSYALGAILLALIAAAVFCMVWTKKYALFGVLFGIVVQLLAVAATTAAMYLIFLLLSLVLSGFDVLNPHSMGTFVLSNPGVLIAFMLLAAVISAMFYLVLKRMFAVKAPNVARGNALLFGFVAAIVSFAAPSAAYLFAFAALGQMAVLLASMFFKDAFRKKAGFDIERLFLYAVPVILMLPLLAAELSVLSSVTALVMLPVYTAVFMLFAGGILPYIDYLKKPITWLVAKLPQRTYRERVMVTERREDAAKKGKFTKVEVEKVVKNKIPRVYAHAHGITLGAAAFFIMLVLCSAFGHPAGEARSSDFAYADGIYKDSMVYVWDNGAASLEIRDLDSYKYYRQYIDGFSWDGGRGAYVKTAPSMGGYPATQPTVNKLDETGVKGFSVTAPDLGSSLFTLTLSGFSAGDLDKVIVKNGDREAYEFEVENSELDSVVIRLPYGIDDTNGFTVKLEGAAITSVTVDVDQRRFNLGETNTQSSDWEKIRSEYSNDPAILSLLNFSMRFYYNSTITF